MKLFSTKTHGVLDYLTAGLLIALPGMMGWHGNVGKVVRNMGIGTLLYSVLTDYELGVIRILPMKGHLTLDAMNGALFCAAPMLFPDEDSSVISTLVALGLFEVGASLMTESTPSYENQGALATSGR